MYDEQNLTYYTKNKKIELTLLEHKAFMILLKNKNQITTYKQLCQELYGTELDTYIRGSISIVIYRLRKKFKNEFKIRMRRKLGYVID